MALEMVLRRANVDATVHGFRSAFRDWTGEQTSFPRELAEAVLAYLVGDEVVLTVEFEEVEGVEDHLGVIGAAVQLVEDRQSLGVAPHRLAVDRRRFRPQGRHGRADAGLSVGPVKASAGEQVHPIVPLAGDQAVAVVLDLVNPLRPDRRLVCTARYSRAALKADRHATCDESAAPGSGRQGHTVSQGDGRNGISLVRDLCVWSR